MRRLVQIGDKAEYEVELDTTYSNNHKPKAIQILFYTKRQNSVRKGRVQEKHISVRNTVRKTSCCDTAINPARA